MPTLSKKLALVALLLSLVLVAGCTTAWTSEATNIIGLLVPAIQATLAILAAFGLGISPTVMTDVNAWAADAEKGLIEVKSLIEQYNAGEESAKPGLLNEIQGVLSLITSNLSTILPTIHVTDPSTQAKIAAVIDTIASELQALINLLPAIQGKVTSHEELKKLVSAVKSGKEFRAEFNSKAGAFGKAYEI